MLREQSVRDTYPGRHWSHAFGSLGLWLSALLILGVPARTIATILWSDLGSTLVHENGSGSDMLGGAVKRDNSSSNTLYFKFHVDPLSDVSTEEYLAAFELYEGGAERLAVGNSLKAWAYSAFNTEETGELNKIFGDIDLRSARQEASAPGVFLPYELPRRGIECTIVFKVEYVPGGSDLVTVWMNPDLTPGATEARQPEALTTRFKANASFDEIRLRHTGPGGGWWFSDMAIATSFSDFVNTPAGQPGRRAAGGIRTGNTLTFRLWQREQGLPQNSVRALAQTRDGYLWVGSDDGVARFDGVRFVPFGMREGLRSDSVRVLFEDNEGALWMGTAGGGLTRWRAGQFTTFTTQDGLPSDSVLSLGEDSEGRLWVGTEAGLVEWQAGKLASLAQAAELQGRAITTLFRDHQGTIWVGASGAGVFRFADGKLVPLHDRPVIDSLLLEPHCLLEDRAGRIWIGAGDDCVLCREEGQWRQYRLPRHLARPYVSALAEEPDGTVWAGTVSEGLFQFREGKLSEVDARDGLSDNFVESLLVDSEGNLWVGTGAGLNRLRRSNLSVIGQSEGLGYGPVQGLAELNSGEIWAAKPGDGLYRWQGEVFRRLATEEGAPNYPEVHALLAGQGDSCWVGEAHGLLRFKGPKVGDAELAGLKGLNVLALCRDKQGEFWAGTREGGLWRQQGADWVVNTNILPGHAITSLQCDEEGVLWVGTEGGGLVGYQGGKIARINKSNGLLSNFIRTLHADAEGALWIGTAGGGLSRWKGGRLAPFTTREGLPDNTISQILEDDAGRLWLGSNRGIACVNKQDLEDLAAGKIPAVYPQVFGRAEGMTSEECTGGFYPAGLKTKSGLLWFSTLKGVVVVDPHPQPSATPAPTVLLEEVLVEGTPVEVKALAQPAENGAAGAKKDQAQPLKSFATNWTASLGRTEHGAPETLRAGPGKQRFEFHYTGFSFRAPDRVRFRYRLEGLDPDWVEAGTRRIAPYGYVPPGDYRFRVIACNGEGVWNETGATLAVTVLPYFWQARWFLTLAVLGLLVSVGGAARVVENRKHQRRLEHLEQERTLERERARIAQDLHDDLGSSLTRITLLSDLVKADKESPGQVATHAAKISESAEQTVRALEEIVWALRPGSDSLQSLVEYIAHVANELFEGDTARCRLDLPHDLPTVSLPPEMRHSLFLIVKEALTNALKHAQAREVHVQAKASSEALEIVVQDDGKGFEPRALAAGQVKHHGLGNMRRRAEAMGGRLEVESAPGKGTTVTLNVNFRNGVPSLGGS